MGIKKAYKRDAYRLFKCVVPGAGVEPEHAPTSGTARTQLKYRETRTSRISNQGAKVLENTPMSVAFGHCLGTGIVLL